MKYTTGKRQRIIDFLSENRERAFTLEEISAALTEDGKGKSTVYRLVSDLVCEEKITRISDGRTRRITYQYVGTESCHAHLHLKCKGCGKLVHLDDEVSEKLGQAVLSVGEFFLDEGALLFGKCKECAEVGA
jgi:Fur family ferric uptake transcriptional regulator